MKNIGKYIIIIILLMMFSIMNMNLYDGYKEKQIVWYLLGFFIIFLMNKIHLKNIFKYIFLIYIIFNVLLLYLLFFGNEINGSKAWINLGFLSFQPSEFMKIILIVLLSLVAAFDKKYIKKCFILTLIPSVLTFLEPDTGNVIFYIVIFLSVLIYKEQNMKKFIIPGFCVFLILLSFFIYYFCFPTSFANVFGTKFYYRVDRILELFNNSSYQLNMALINMGASSYFGNALVSSIPEAKTDFAFSLLVSLNGFVGAVIYLSINLFFNITIYNEIKKKKGVMKILVYLFFMLKITQETIHIFMNIGLFPITGIPLPFISYGGTSIITYFIMIALISKDDNKDYSKDYNKDYNKGMVGLHKQVLV